MELSAGLWLFFNFLSIAILAFFSMAEMASVSFNKIRLQYYYSKGHTRAAWLSYLLHNPSRLFGTTLVVVNLAMVISSECAREFYSALGLDPDLAPLTQVLLVVVFGELAPIFAARRYPEHVAMICVPTVYFTAKLLTPVLWIVSWISRISNYLAGGKESDANFYINQEELQKLLEEQDESKIPIEGDFDTITSNIFKMNDKTARQVMEPISSILTIAATATVEEARHLIKKTEESFLPVYLKDFHNIIAIAYPRDLIRAPDNKKLRDYCKPPWFVTHHTNVMQLLKQFKSNNQEVAIILDNNGRTIGIITLDDIMEEIFGKSFTKTRPGKSQQLIIDRTLPADMTIKEFYDHFHVRLSDNNNQTLAELITEAIGHIPEEGASIFIEPFKITVKEATLREVKQVTIETTQF